MNDSILVAGDFSGIQNYVLGVTAAGGGQARRLRARSFFVQFLGEVVLWKLLREFGGRWEDVLIGGGGQLLLRLGGAPSCERRLEALRDETNRMPFAELRAELGLTLVGAVGRGSSPGARNSRSADFGGRWWRTEKAGAARPCRSARSRVRARFAGDAAQPGSGTATRTRFACASDTMTTRRSAGWERVATQL